MEINNSELIMQKLEQLQHDMNSFKQDTNSQFTELKHEIRTLRDDTNIGLMRLLIKTDEDKEINNRQHSNIYELIESRFQEDKKDRKSLHQTQDALIFRVKQLETHLGIN